MVDPQQGQYTYAHARDAQSRLDAMMRGNDEARIREVYGPNALGSFQVRPVACYPGHFDPMTCWFD